MAKKLVKNYVFNPGLGLSDNARPNAVSLLQSNRIFLIKEYVSYIQNQVTANNPDYLGITYNYITKEQEATNIIDALIFDIRYNGNERTRRTAFTYWEENVPQIPGNRIAEVEAIQYINTLINTYILTNTLYSTPEQTDATQIVGSLSVEAETTTRVTALLTDLEDYITDYTNSITLEIGLGRVEILGKILLQDLLIITNVTDNQVIYNFADSSRGGVVEFQVGDTEAYPQAAAINNGTTVINFNYDTSSMSSTDDIQIFLEQPEQTIRFNSIATDAMERMKVGIPQAMIDADFEYGLQPTKWQAIATERGYPTTYEIPASEILVTAVTTDASAGTGGIGASLITVTTQGAHSLTTGQPITIKALSSSILGFNRAEGTFIINSVPTASTFTYYAKAKVGTSNGQTLATTNTQLRESKFYTGAGVGQPIITVPSNGANSSFTTALVAPSGTSNLTFAGTAPPVGVVLSGTGIAAGTQVSGVFGGNNTNGIETTKFVANDFTSGGSSITLVDVNGISAGMILRSDGSGTAQQRVITSIVGNTLQLNGAINLNYTGDIQTYNNLILSTSNYIVGTGTGATFDVIIDGGLNYSIGINNSGSSYQQGDTLRILGTALGGASPANDLYISVDFVSAGAIVQASIISTSSGASAASFTNVATTQVANPYVANGSVNIQKASGSYAPAGASGGTNFRIGQRYLVSGTSLAGNSPNNDATVTITQTSAGQIVNFTVTGTSARGNSIDIFGGISLSQATTAQISGGETISATGIATIRIDFQDDHGLIPGAAILVDITSTGTNHNIADGPYFVQRVISSQIIEYIARTTGTIDTSTDDLEGKVYVRADAFFTHRPFDGGVQLGTGSPQHGNHAIRMSKKYIRYQSGKGAMYNTGALFAPSFDIGSITADGTAVGSIITITTDDVDHGLQAGASIKLTGVKTVGYNGEYRVVEIIDERSFKVTAQKILGNTTATIGSQCQAALYRWHGAVVRSGCFDDQNGIFWQYDGQQMAVGRRSGTFQCAGTIAMSPDDTTVVGTNTRFLDQLQEGDRIVLKGMTHVVTNITNNTLMSISPGFRGVRNIIGAKISKVEDTIIPQSEWNIDRCDGTGPSGYDIDVTKMQMIGIQFTWYGAGFIDWMLRGPDGNYIFCHRIKGNNLNTEAYMRTGNLPVRYEVLNESARSKLRIALTNSATTIDLESSKDFPENGTVYIKNELISYTGKNDETNQLTGCTRAATLQNFAGGSTRSYTAGAATGYNPGQGVVLVSCTTTPIISHWGSAYLIDGQFDEDRGYIFSYPATGLTVSTVKQTAFLIRLAPSVSNAIVGDLGERELLNRAQLLLDSLTIASESISGGGGIVVEGVLNPQNYPENPNDITWNGLNNAAAGGQPSFAQIALGSSVNWQGGSQVIQTTATVQGVVSTSLALQAVFSNGRTIRSGRNRVYATDANWAASGLTIGDRINIGAFPAGTTIQSIVVNWEGTGDTRINLSNDPTSDSTSGTATFEAGGTAASYTNSNTLVFTAASWTNSGAIQGSLVASSEFPANTRVSGVSTRTVGGTTFVRASFTQSFTGTFNAAGTVTFDFTAPAAASPGETVFSFIASPGQDNTINLTSLKELTTTAIGGRGTFPNGPDVLAINVYKVSGSDTTANMLLKWGEAQA